MVKIYGIYECYKFSNLRGEEIKIKEEHAELWEIIDSITESRIGVEMDENLPRSVRRNPQALEDLKIHFDIKERLKDRNTVISFADNKGFSKYKRLLKKAELIEKVSKLKSLKNRTLANHYFYIGQHEVMAANILKANLDFAFMGAEHARYMHQHNISDEVFIEYPSNIESVENMIERNFLYSYSEEQFKKSLKADMKFNPLRYRLINIKDMPKEIYDKYHRENDETVMFTKKLHNLITNGTITKRERTPDYIGTWGLTKFLPVSGIFEMYIDSKDGEDVQGRIIDSLGDALFLGEISEKSVSFKKMYDKSIDIAAKSEVIYEGSMTEAGFYKGTYGSRAARGEFVLVKYKPGLEKRIINARDNKHLFRGLSV